MRGSRTNRAFIGLVGSLGLAAVTMPAAAAAAEAVAESPNQLSPAATPRCAGEAATMVGTKKADKLRGTSGRDVIVGHGGADKIFGLGGDDLICGGAGYDTLIGGAGNDRLYGQRDALLSDRGGDVAVGDTLRGGVGEDDLVPGVDPRQSDPDILSYPDRVSYKDATRGVRVDLSSSAGTATGRGHDTIVVRGPLGVEGSQFADDIVGSELRNVIESGGGGDVIDARGGGDEVYADLGENARDRDVIDLGTGNDVGNAYGGRDTIRGDEGDDWLTTYGKDPDVLEGGAGNDFISHRFFASDGLVSDGGPGRDRLEINEDTPGVGSRWANINLKTGDFTYQLERTVTGRVIGFEDLTFYGTRGKWRVVGTDAAEKVKTYGGGPLRVWLGGGDDTARGTSRNDYLDMGEGNDLVRGSSGTDTCISAERAFGCER